MQLELYRIEENVPVPGSDEPGVLETLDKLEVGQSVSIPATKSRSFSAQASKHFHSKKTKRFTIGTTGQPEGTARVWRKA